MKLSELRQDRFAASKAASDQARSFALAGLAVVWLFVANFFLKQNQQAQEPSNWLVAAGALFAGGLLFDLSQLFLRAVALRAVYRNRENAQTKKQEAQRVRQPVLDDEAEVDDVGPWPNRLTQGPFYLKFACLLAAYVCLLIYFVIQF